MNQLFLEVIILKLVVISDALKKYLSEYKLNYNKIEIHHDAANQIDFNKIKKVKLLGNINKLQIGYVGHLYKGRGIDIIIECAKVLKNFDFNIVGGNEKDICYWEKKVYQIYFFMASSLKKKYLHTW